MKINEVAKLTGVTVRTLHYYDEIGLLRPGAVTEAGYRVYDAAELETLQQILFLRELDFPLSEIRELLAQPDYDRDDVLKKQRELLMQKRARLDGLIALLDDTVKGEAKMSFKAFDKSEIEESKRKYADEVKERWGMTEEYRQSAEKDASRSEGERDAMGAQAEEIISAFAAARTLPPESSEARELVKRWQDYISATSYNCTREMLMCLGQMYVGDSRFTENIDRAGAGTAEFMSRAIAAYCK